MSKNTNKKIFYVYQFVIKDSEEVIYIGKGKDNRKNQHYIDARKGKDSPLCEELRRRNYEEGVYVEILESNLSESIALRREVDLIREIGLKKHGEGTLLNQTAGGEGQSGGLDSYGYKKNGISGWIAEMVDGGIDIEEMPSVLMSKIEKSGRFFKETNERIIPHLQEMGNSGCHYKGAKQYLQGWQFTLDGVPLNINTISLNTKGFLKVHSDKPWNCGEVSPIE